jgi:hypothetical protein
MIIRHLGVGISWFIEENKDLREGRDDLGEESSKSIRGSNECMEESS